MQPVLLLSGAPRVGKTTLIKGAVNTCPDRYGGFYTEEHLEDGRRSGFHLVCLRGPKALFASTQFKAHSYNRIGSYGIDIAVLEQLGLPALWSAIRERQIVVIDEIGPMQVLSRQFCDSVWDLLNDPSVSVLGTIAQVANPFINAVRQHERVRLLTVTAEVRNRGVDLSRWCEF